MSEAAAAPPVTPPPAAPRSAAARWLRRLGWAAAGVILLGVLLWLGVPPLVKSQAEQGLGEALGRRVSIGAVDFKPWTLELTVRQLVIGAAPGAPAGAPPLLRLGSVYVDADARSIWNRAPVVQALQLDAPEIHLARTAEGHYDIDDLLARFAPKPDAAPAGEPLRFAIYNVAVRGAALHFDDRPVQRQHHVTALELALPFVSNLPAQVEVKVQPRLAFRFNGTAFDTGAQATPFASTRAASLKFSMAPLDLQPYTAYLPASLPVRLLRGQVDADLALDFTQPPNAAPQVTLRGQVGAAGFALAAASDAQRAPLLEWQRIGLQLRDVRPLLRQVGLGTLKIEAPQLHLARDAKGQLNLLGLLPPPAAPAAAASAAPAAAQAAWALTLDALEVSAMRVHWADAAVKPAAALLLDDVALRSGPLAWPLKAPVPLKLSAQLQRAGGAAPVASAASAASAAPATELGQLAVEGRFDAGTQRGEVDVKLEGLALQALAPYLAPHFAPAVEGRLALGGHAELALAGTAPQLTLRDATLGLEDLRVLEAAAPATAAAGKAKPGARPASKPQPVLALKQLAVSGVTLDLAARRVGVAQVRLVQPQAQVQRDGQGVWNVQRWAVAAPPAASPARGAMRPAVAAAPAAAAPAWRVDLREAVLDGGQLRFSDAQAGGTPAGGGGGEAVAFEVKGLKLALQNLALSAGPAGVRTATPATVRLSAKLTAAASERGAAAQAALDWRGQVGAQPLLARGALKLERFPVHLFEPYFGQRLKLVLERAEVGAKTDVLVQETAAGLRVKATGDVLLADVKVDARETDGSAGDPLLTWQSFNLKGVNVALEPGRPPSIAVAEAALDNFYSRLVITEQGRFNLQDVGAADDAAAATPADAAASAPPAAAATVAQAGPAPAASAPAVAAAPKAPGPDINIGATVLTNGRIDFTDRFVRPSYSAALTELNGRLGAFRSGTRDMATLELRGRAAGTALLDISGQLNPTADPLALDIRAKATDLELAPLSPYAGKYAGYAIERGKLSMDVAYKIDPDGKLDAKNQVILNQLTFGEKIDSPTATKLPVLFAVALLKDRNGVIDINLPVSGSIKDPQFSVGGIIWKVILNLIGRALTAPFSLFSGGGGDDLSVVEFAPGTANVASAGTAALDKVAKALSDRPALKMTVTGAADPVSEREAFQQAALDARLLNERRKELSRSGAAAEVVNATVSLNAEERARLLKEVYRQTSFPEKPKNFIGMAKDVPPAEMERLLKARTLASVDAVRELALQRGLAVRDALIARGLPSERLFLAAPKLRASGEDDAAWKPQVQLTLSAN